MCLVVRRYVATDECKHSCNGACMELYLPWFRFAPPCVLFSAIDAAAKAIAVVLRGGMAA